jgi:hypothetical protein
MRKRSEPHTFEQRLTEQRLRLEAEAASLPQGDARNAIVKRIERLQHAADMNMWLSRGGDRSGASVHAREMQPAGGE